MAEFIFVPAQQVESKAKELGAIPFDIENCEFGLHGDAGSFDTFLKIYKLSYQANTTTTTRQ